LIENIKNLHALETITVDFKTYGVTYLYTIPVLIFLLGNIPNAKENFKTLKLVTTGGYKLPETIFVNFKRRFDLEIHEGYGLTEAAPVCSWHHPEDKIKIESIGLPFKCCKFKVIDMDGSILPTDTVGELCVQGEHVMEGYYRNSETNSKILKSGWLHTGDKGKIDRDGYIYITGLYKNMVSVGGRNVYPEELKRMLLQNSNLATVNLQFSENFLTGTKISANIKLKNDAVELQSEFMKWCIRNIAAYKLPKFWEFTD
jgi:long-chain acyl-CoA synthetase